MAWIRGRNRRFALGISCFTNGAEYNGCKIGWNDCERYCQGRWEGFLEGFGSVVFAGNPQHIHQLYGPYTFLLFVQNLTRLRSGISNLYSPFDYEHD